MTKRVGSYASQERAAVYLTAEWGDFLIEPNTSLATWIKRAFGTHPTIRFYQQIKELTSPYLRQESHVLDVGSATGRMIYELACSDVDFASLTGCEMSKLFSDYARAILLGNCVKPEIPTLCDSSYKIQTCNFRLSRLNTVQHSCGGKKIRLLNEDVHGLLKKERPFDAVFCLNVLDRHPSPQKLVADLTHLVSSSGILCVACSFDWDLSPARKRDRRDDLVDFFPAKHWDTLRNEDLDYVVIGSGRQAYVYRAQVAVLRKNHTQLG